MGQAMGATYPKASCDPSFIGNRGRPATRARRAGGDGTLGAWRPIGSAKRISWRILQRADFENFAQPYGAAGDVYQLPQKFNGDYLAVVNSDINAESRNSMSPQSINFDAEIGSDGTVDEPI